MLRVGSGASPLAPGVAQPLFIDEYTASVGQSSPVHSLPVSGVNACTLSALSVPTWLYDEEGVPSLSSDGSFLVFPCYPIPAGTPLTDNTGVKVAAVVRYSSFVSTDTAVAGVATAVPDAVAPQALRMVVSNGTGLWWGVQAYSSNWTSSGSGIVFSGMGAGATPTFVCSPANPNECAGFNGKWSGSLGLTGAGVVSLLYTDCSEGALPSLGLDGFSSLPTSANSAAMGVFASSYSPYGFAFANSSVVWMAETATTMDNNLAQWAWRGGGGGGGSGGWARGTTVLLEAGTRVISLIGRNESGCGWSMGVFVLYAVSPSTLYSYNTATGVVSALAGAPAETVFRGVVSAPFSAPPVWPSCTPTQTPSGTQAATASLTHGARPSISATPPFSTSVTSTMTASSAASVSALPSGFFSPSATSSPTLTLSSSWTSSSTAVSTRTPTASLSSGASPSFTPSATASASAVSTPSLTATSSITSSATPSSTTSTSVSASPAPVFPDVVLMFQVNVTGLSAAVILGNSTIADLLRGSVFCGVVQAANVTSVLIASVFGEGALVPVYTNSDLNAATVNGLVCDTRRMRVLAGIPSPSASSTPTSVVQFNLVISAPTEASQNCSLSVSLVGGESAADCSARVSASLASSVVSVQQIVAEAFAASNNSTASLRELSAQASNPLVVSLQSGAQLLAVMLSLPLGSLVFTVSSLAVPGDLNPPPSPPDSVPPSGLGVLGAVLIGVLLGGACVAGTAVGVYYACVRWRAATAAASPTGGGRFGLTRRPGFHVVALFDAESVKHNPMLKKVLSRSHSSLQLKDQPPPLVRSPVSVRRGLVSSPPTTTSPGLSSGATRSRVRGVFSPMGVASPHRTLTAVQSEEAWTLFTGRLPLGGAPEGGAARTVVLAATPPRAQTVSGPLASIPEEEVGQE